MERQVTRGNKRQARTRVRVVVAEPHAGSRLSYPWELLPPKSECENDVNYRKSGRPLGTARDVRRA